MTHNRKIVISESRRDMILASSVKIKGKSRNAITEHERCTDHLRGVADV